ncbi:TetR/AcrR family transcriptional regulator [Phytomonospora endophytica]|uniref:AcrR family transcriptional regulator n=1 Tax=Phytomonospora endophytica TaxID=714109 RepID=A0A841FNY2_9ACTN|nr:TetR/AcrR family transcriptional regulator [Phytomonospora endophytica]MBB6037534.1 AcrR family transcriptional regulator [Phytomonospora endophytica]
MSPGRARDADIDARVLAAAARMLSAQGYEGLSVAAVAAEAGTTRQALYRRWPGKAELAAAAVEAMETTAANHDGPPYAALVAELEDFAVAIQRPGRLSLVGTMLQDMTDPEARERYRHRIIAPRRQRLRAILERARCNGHIDPDADLDIAVTMCTGSWYGRALATNEVPDAWARRVAAVVWRGVGGG